jgi:hypothetical protein
LTSVPIVHAANGDITAYLPTNIMSITDGQWILDMDIFRNGIRPALNIGLSVTRAGGVGHNKRQKDLAAQTLKMLASYRQAEEFSHFGSELGAEAKHALATGKRVFELLTQAPGQTFSLMAQQLMLDIVLNLEEGATLDINALKLNANDFATKVNGDDDYQRVHDMLLQTCVKSAPKPEPKEQKPAETMADAGKEAHDSDKKSDKKLHKAEKNTDKSDEPDTNEVTTPSADSSATPGNQITPSVPSETPKDEPRDDSTQPPAEQVASSEQQVVPTAKTTTASQVDEEQKVDEMLSIDLERQKEKATHEEKTS